MQHSSEQVCKELGIGRNSLDKVRRQLRKRGKLVDYQPVDDEMLAVISDIVDVQRAKRCPWEIAVDIVLDAPPPVAKVSAEGNQSLIGNMDDQLAANLFRRFCIENGVGSDTEVDFLESLIQDELKEVRKVVGNLLIRAIAFSYATSKGFIKEINASD